MSEQISVLIRNKDYNLAFEQIVDEYTERLYWVIRKMVRVHEDADDILQETFVKIWKNLSKFQGKSALYSWMYRIAVNESLLHLRKQKMKFVDMDNQLMNLEQTLVADPLFDGNQAQIELQKAIEQLPDKQRAVFVLRYFEEMNYDNMSQVLEATSGSLRASYHIAVKKIEQSIRKQIA